MNSADFEQRFAIHLGVDDTMVARLEADARSRGMSVIELDLSDVWERSTLSDYLAKAFAFPHETSGLDAAIDMISDLGWFGNDAGHLVVARGLGDQSPVTEMFASILPNVVDRWRSQAVPFVVAIDGRGERLQSALRSANRELDRAGGLPWAQPGTGAVAVVVHGTEASETG